MSYLSRPYFVVRYLPNNTAMPHLKGCASWWIPDQALDKEQVRLFLTEKAAQGALNAWRKGGLVKSCRLHDLTRAEAANYAIGCHTHDLMGVWESRNIDEGPLGGSTVGFHGPIYVQSLQVQGWDAAARQACMDLVVTQVVFQRI